MLYYLYVAGFYLAKALPIKACYAIAELVAWGYYFFAEKDKEGLRANLRIVLGPDVAEAEIDRHILSVFRNFAKYLADFFKFPKFSKEYIEKHIEVKGNQHIDEALSEGKGCILVSLHLGNWEMGGAVTAALGYPVNAIVLEHSDKRIDDFFTRQRSINNMKPIPIGIGLRQCFSALKRGETLAIVGDKDYTGSGIEVEFFGKPALMPKGPAVFALKRGAPMVVIILVRKKDDTFALHAEGPIRYETTGNFDEDVKSLMKKYLGVLEGCVREYPDQWYAFKKIWNHEPTIQ